MLLCSRSIQTRPKPAAFAIRTISVVLALRIPRANTGVPARNRSRRLPGMCRRRWAISGEEARQIVARDLRAEASPHEVIAVIAVRYFEEHTRNAELHEPRIELNMARDGHQMIACTIRNHRCRQA